MRRVAVVGALVLAGAAVLTPGPAVAGPVHCAFDAATGVLRVDLTGDTDATLRRGPNDGILVNGNTCGATMFNADRVRVVGDGGDQTLVLDLGGGRFGPGATHEETKISEVEVSFEAGHGTDEFDVWGTDHADEINASVGVIELNHDGDAGDAFGWGIDRVEIDGLGGSDDLRANSYRGLVVADGGSGKDLVKGWHFADHLRGGSGADRIVGLDGNDRIDAGSGVDTVLAGDGNDRLRVGDSTIEHQIACGPGTDTVQTWDVGDDGVATACENWAT